MPSFTSPDGHEISYRVLGEGKPLLLVHGWMVSGAIWDPITDALQQAGYQLFIPDQRGAGDSAKPDSGYGIEQYAADVEALAQAASLDRFDMIGHSMGGQIAQVAAAELGDRVGQLVLLCSVPAAGMPLPDEAAQLFRTSAGNREAQATILNMACKQLDEQGLETILGVAESVAAPCIEQSFDAWTGGGFADRLGKISAQTHVYGTDDPFLTPETLNKMVVEPIPNAKFHHQPGPGHYPQVETPRETGERLRVILS